MTALEGVRGDKSLFRPFISVGGVCFESVSVFSAPLLVDVLNLGDGKQLSKPGDDAVGVGRGEWGGKCRVVESVDHSLRNLRPALVRAPRAVWPDFIADLSGNSFERRFACTDVGELASGVAGVPLADDVHIFVVDDVIREWLGRR